MSSVIGITVGTPLNPEKIKKETLSQVSPDIAEAKAKISSCEKRLTNLEQGITPEPFETDSSVAYVKDVPENALPYAEIVKVGGMTHKCNNLFNQESFFAGRGFTKQSDGSWLCNTIHMAVFTPTVSSKMYFKVTAKSTGAHTSTPFKIQVRYSDGTDEDVCSLANSQTNWITLSGSSNSSKTITSVYFTCGGSTGTTKTHYIKDLIFSYSDVPYEPYYEGLRDTAVTEIKSVGVNIFGGDALADRFVESASAKKNAESQIVTYSSDAIHGKRFYLNFKPNTVYTFILYGHHHISTNRDTNIGIRYTDGNNDWLKFSNAGSDSYCVVTSDVGKSIDFIFGVSNDSGDVTLYYDKCGIFEGVLTKADFKPYTESSLAIPEAVQAIDGYGQGNPDDVTEYNSIFWDEFGNCYYSHKGNKVNGVWVPLATPEVTDITDLITPDNFIKVEGGGTITAVNENSQAVPTEITYMLREVAV